MTTLQTINTRHSEELDLLNERIHSRLATGSSLMSRIILSMLQSKGKQLRPLLLMMCARMFGPVTDRVLDAAVAVELLHNASLVHDDVVDDSMTRRGRPTVNAVWNNHIAVLVGDYFTSSAMQAAIATDDIRIVDALCKLGRRLSLGEIDQISNAREHTLDIESYFRVIDYKTASLFVASAEMGCYASGAPESAREILADFAADFGRCFQLRDDVFDYFDSDAVGKPTGNDLREGKVTLPLLYALEAASPADRTAALEVLGRDNLDTAEIAYLQAFARDNGGIERAYEEMRRLRDAGCGALRKLPANPIVDELTALFDFIIERKY